MNDGQILRAYFGKHWARKASMALGTSRGFIYRVATGKKALPRRRKILMLQRIGQRKEQAAKECEAAIAAAVVERAARIAALDSVALWLQGDLIRQDRYRPKKEGP